MTASWFVNRAVTYAAYVCRVKPRVVLSPTRVRTVTRARNLAYWLARETSSCTWLELAEVFRKDHSTLVRGAQIIERGLVENDLDILGLVQEVLDLNRPWREELAESEPPDHFAYFRRRWGYGTDGI